MMLRSTTGDDPQARGLAGGDGGSPTVIDAEGGRGSILIADAHLLFNADFTRDSTDLVLTGDDGAQTIVRNYFTQDTGLDLVSPQGAVLGFDTVKLLAGPLAPAQYAQASVPQAGEAIGKLVTGEATVDRLDGTTDTLRVGDTVYRGRCPADRP